MATRMAMQLSRNLRFCAKELSGSAKASSAERFSRGARSYCSGSLSQTQSPLPAATLITAFRRAASVSGYGFFAYWIYCYGLSGPRKRYATWRAEKKMQAMLEKLERGNYESAEAYLVELDREAKALMVDVSNRKPDYVKMYPHQRFDDGFNLDANRREIAVLKEKLLAWESESQK